MKKKRDVNVFDKLEQREASFDYAERRKRSKRI